MSGRWLKVHLVDRRAVCSNSIYDYFIDSHIVAACKDQPTELKKIGLALQQLVSHQQPSFRNGNARILCVFRQKNTYAFIIEHLDLIEVHTQVPEPNDDPLKEIEIKSEPQPALTFEDSHLDTVERNLKTGIFSSGSKQAAICFAPVTAVESDTFITPEQAQCEASLRQLGARAAEQTNLFREINQLHVKNQAAILHCKNMLQTEQTQIPTEALPFWTTPQETLTELDTLLTAEQHAVAIHEHELQHINERTQAHLLRSYDILRGNEQGFLKPIHIAILQVLQDTALSYCHYLLTNNTAPLAHEKIQEFNDTFQGVARLTQRQPTIKNGKHVIIFELDKQLAKRNLNDIAALINRFFSVCKNYLSWTYTSTARTLFCKLLDASATLKDNYTLADTQFRWDDTVTHTNSQSLFDSKQLDIALIRFPVGVRKTHHDGDQLQARIPPLAAAITEASKRTTPLREKWMRLKVASQESCQPIPAALSQAETLYVATIQQKTACLALAKTHTSDAHFSKIEKIYTALSAHMDTLRREAKAIDDSHQRVQNTLSIAAATSLRADQAVHIEQFSASHQAIGSKSKQLDQIYQVLSAQDKNNKEAEVKAREEAARQAQEKAEQEAALRLMTAARQKEAARQAAVIEAAKVIAHVLSAVSHWHHQISAWGGGVSVPNPAGGESLTVPHGISEMIQQKSRVNFNALTYDKAERFMAALKNCAAKAKQRNGWVLCCIAVRTEKTTGELYRFLNDYDVTQPSTAVKQKMDRIYPDWQKDYGMVSNKTPLLSDQPLADSPRVSFM